eukprot:m.89685 g.89685  ORF g.89685 m.89685 type:complete len:346 (-) comp8541_c0_seq2:1340-2377(-)
MGRQHRAIQWHVALVCSTDGRACWYSVSTSCSLARRAHAPRRFHQCPLHNWGTNSAIVRAESASPEGPFRFAETVVAPFAHNPTIRAMPDGSGFLLFFIGGSPAKPANCSAPNTALGSAVMRSGITAAFSTTPFGPWEFRAVEFADRSTLLHGGWTNPSPHVHPNGSITLAFQAQPANKSWELLGVAHAPSWRAPFSYLSPEPVTRELPGCVAGRAEDPFFWMSDRGFHLVMHGMCPTGVFQAHYAFSTDGIHWSLSPHQTYRYRVEFSDAPAQTFARVERPQLAFAKFNTTTGHYSLPTVLFNGVCADIQCLFALDQSTASVPSRGEGMSFTLARLLAQQPLTL